jgi:uncharacterized protein (DUF362 family)
MAKLSRRDFIRIGALGVGSLTVGQFLSACTQLLSPQTSPTDSPASPASSTDIPTLETAPSPTQVSPTETVTPLNFPDLVVARGGEPEALVRQSLAAIGGMERFVPRNANVIIKPNICVGYSYEYAATTNPWVVGTLVKLCFEAGAGSVRVMDYPYGTEAKNGYKTSGIKDQVEAAGGEMAFMAPVFKYVKTAIPAGKDLKETEVFGDVLNADVLINVPIAKDHVITRLTLGMKNLMGVILDRDTIHVNPGQRIADLNSLIRPQLTVVDAVRILVANGPGGGNLDDVRKLDTLIVSPDIVAADSYATTLFGFKPTDIAYITRAAAMGLGHMDIENLNIKEISVAG